MEERRRERKRVNKGGREKKRVKSIEYHGREYKRMEERWKLDRLRKCGVHIKKTHIIDLPQFAENTTIHCYIFGRHS